MGRKRIYEDSRERRREAKRRKRKNAAYKKAEQATNTAKRQQARKSTPTATRDRKVDQKARQKRRSSKTRRTAEQQSNTAKRSIARTSITVSRRDRKIDLMCKQKRRTSPTKRASEQENNTAKRSIARTSITVSRRDRKIDLMCKQKRRTSPTKRASEQENNTTKRNIARKSITVSRRDRKIDLMCKQKRRTSPTKRASEQENNTASRNIARKSITVAQRDKKTNKRCMERTRLLTSSPATDRLDTPQHSTWEYNQYIFTCSIYEQPEYICCSCGILWYKRSVTETIQTKALQINPLKILKKLERKGKYFICHTCSRSVTRNEKPKLALSNGLMFPDVPETIVNLTRLEERLVALRTPFMQIRSLGKGQQKGIFGGIINVPCNVECLPKVLPRKFNETSVVQVKFMRRRVYKTPYIYETVRPLQVYNALNILMKTELYKEENVVLSDDWKLCKPNALINFIVEEEDKKAPHVDANTLNNDADENEHEGLEDLECTETLLEDENVPLYIAPSEGNNPRSLLSDKHAEELSFPTIYGGQKRTLTDARITRNDIAKSELRRYDRRCARADKLFFSYKLVLTNRLHENVQFALRRKKKKGQIAARDLLGKDSLKNLVQEDCGFRIFQSVTGSPAYLEKKKKNAMALIRQLGLPTFFITISSAETKWPDLLCMLSNLHHHKSLTPEEVMELSIEERSALVRDDPVLCVIHYENREKALQKLFDAEHGLFHPFKCTDYIHRREVQQRGSLHGHRMQYIEGAPIYDGSDESSELCCKFIDTFITCSNGESETMKQLVSYQFHCHKKSCYNSSKNVCRFGFPKPPLPKTMILKPLECCEHEKKKHGVNFQTIQDFLNSFPQNSTEEFSFSDLLVRLKMTEETYINAIRSSLKRPKEFLKRNLSEIFINQYNKKLLEVWRANVDIQFILDPYACASYCINYISKSNRGSSRLMNKIDRDIRRGNMSLAERLRFLISTFLNSTENSTQEVSVSALGFSMVLLSRDVVYINTAPPDSRTVILKSLAELQSLDPESTDIAASNFLNHYENRPNEYNDVCLADFASMFTVYLADAKIQKPKKMKKELVVCPRIKPRIIRYCRYSKEIDPENYFREQCMLFVPYRSEEAEILNVDCSEKYKLFEQVIVTRRAKYNAGSKVDFSVVEEEERSCHDEYEPDQEQLEQVFEKQDFGIEMGINQLPFEFIRTPKPCSTSEYIDQLRCLNSKQREYFLHISSAIKAGIVVRDLIHGQAGTGKSKLINAIVELVTREFTMQPGYNLDSPPVLVCAPTGKAAWNISGCTLHSGLRLPHSHYGGTSMAELDPSTFNTLRCKLANLVLLIIDEISLVSFRDFYWTNRRIRQIFQSICNFARVSVICVGDFWQLPPVLGGFVFGKHGSYISKMKSKGTPWDESLWDEFQMFELEEVMRQKDDKRFAEALHRLAMADCSEDDVALFKTRENVKCTATDAIHLFHSNKLCDEFNLSYIRKFPGPLHKVTAYDLVQGDGPLHDKRYLLDSAKSWDIANSDGLPYSVYLKVGCIYMVTTNVDVSDGLFNGATGILRKIEFGTQGKEKTISLVYMDFKDPNVGQKARDMYTKIQNWTPIFFSKKVLKKQSRNKNLHIVRKMIPLRCANAITIHKSQGSTLSNVVVHISDEKNLSRAHLYVAFSRVTSLKDLYIVGSFRRPSFSDSNDGVQAELNRLKTKGFVSEARKWHQSSNIKGVIHNIQSIKKYVSFFRKDQFLMTADFLVFLEPHTTSNQYVKLDGFYDYSALPQLSTQSKGCVVYLRQKSDVSMVVLDEYTYACFEVKRYIMFCAYRPPRTSLKTFLEALDSYLLTHPLPDIICGDFNVDLLCETTERKIFLDFMFQRGYCSILPFTSTTALNSMLDVVFARKSLSGWASQYFNLGSVHFPILFEVNGTKPATVSDRDDLSFQRSSTHENRSALSENVTALPPISDGIVDNHKTQTSFDTESKQKAPIKSTKRSGIMNVGNTCYINAILQILACIPEIKGLQSCFLSEYLNHIDKQTLGITLARKLKKQIGIMYPQYSTNEQQDASEFLSTLLDDTIFDDIRNANILTYELRDICKRCSHETILRQYDPSVILHITPSRSFQDSVNQELLGEETVEKTCEICQSRTCLRTKRLETRPKYIFITSRLFEFDFNTLQPKKLSGMTVLDTVTVDGMDYELIAVVCHRGKMLNEGHYVAFIRNIDTYTLLDDDKVITKTEVLGDAYIHLYKKIAQM